MGLLMVPGSNERMPYVAIKITKRTQFKGTRRMTSFRQLEANRRNARLSTGPITEEARSGRGGMRSAMGLPPKP
jgi:hypothetical protein